jgi:hypothetical protein
MTPKFTLIALFVVMVGMSIILWQATLEHMQYALPWMSTFGCTFSCHSHTVDIFISGVAISTLMTAAAVCSLLLAIVHRRG